MDVITEDNSLFCNGALVPAITVSDYSILDCQRIGTNYPAFPTESPAPPPPEPLYSPFTNGFSTGFE